MKFLFFGIFAFAGSFAVTINFDQSNESTEALWSKLRNYQNVTGISEKTMMSIWQKSVDIRAGVLKGERTFMENFIVETL